MKRLKKFAAALALCFTLILPQNARADLFGGDVAVLANILIQAIQQVSQLQQILSTGSDTLGLLRDVNRGVRDGLLAIQMTNPGFSPGLYGNLNTADQVLRAVQDLYGSVPQSGETRLQKAQDTSAAEGIAMNGTLFRFADQADNEGRRIFSHSQSVSPQGAAKLTAQALAVLIGVTTQVLRTDSMMLKMMSENLALQNRRDKLQSAQFRTQYDGISGAFGTLPSSMALKPLNGGN